jgi:hypothetical protein
MRNDVKGSSFLVGTAILADLALGPTAFMHPTPGTSVNVFSYIVNALSHSAPTLQQSQGWRPRTNQTGLPHALPRITTGTRLLSLIAPLILAACVSQNEYDSLQAEAHKLQTRNSVLSRQLVADSKQIRRLQRTVRSTLDTVERLAGSSRSTGAHIGLLPNSISEPEGERRDRTTVPGVE